MHEALVRGVARIGHVRAGTLRVVVQPVEIVDGITQ